MTNLEERIDRTALEILRSFKEGNTKAIEKENKNLKNKLEKFKEKHKQRQLERKRQYTQKLEEQKETYEKKIEQNNTKYEQKISEYESKKQSQEQLENIHKIYEQRINELEKIYETRIKDLQTEILNIRSKDNSEEIKKEAYLMGQEALRPSLAEYQKKCEQLEEKLSEKRGQNIKKYLKITAYLILAAKIATTAAFTGYYLAQEHKTKEYTTYPASSQQR